MQVLNLRLNQYRNFSLQEIEFCSGTNVFFGLNGQGKTNLLEAIYLFGYARSFRTSTPKDCVQYGRQECALQATVKHAQMKRELGISISLTGDKQLSVHRKPAGLVEFLGSLHVLAFTQEHLKVVRGGPVERRAFLDRAMITVCPGHMQRLAAYGRALKQRNRLLGSALAGGRRPDSELLDSWDEKLIQEGSRVLSNRRLYVEEMKQELVHTFCSTEDLELRYASTVMKRAAGTPAIADEFRQRLGEARMVDERKGFTTTGPHRDDLILLLNGRSLADFGSAGQQRSCLLSLYFTQMEIHRKTCGFYPVFLMDDVEAELDDQRLKAFLRHLSQRTQTFLTTAKAHVLPELEDDARRFLVREGRIEPQVP